MNQTIDEKSTPRSLPRISSYICFTLILSSSTLFTFLFLSDPFPVELLRPYIPSFLASWPSTCTPQSSSLDTCPIKVLLKVVEGVASCEDIVQRSLLY